MLLESGDLGYVMTQYDLITDMCVCTPACVDQQGLAADLPCLDKQIYFTLN